LEAADRRTRATDGCSGSGRRRGGRSEERSETRDSTGNEAAALPVLGLGMASAIDVKQIELMARFHGDDRRDSGLEGTAWGRNQAGLESGGATDERWAFRGNAKEPGDDLTRECGIDLRLDDRGGGGRADHTGLCAGIRSCLRLRHRRDLSLRGHEFDSLGGGPDVIAVKREVGDLGPLHLSVESEASLKNMDLGEVRQGHVGSSERELADGLSKRLDFGRVGIHDAGLRSAEPEFTHAFQDVGNGLASEACGDAARKDVLSSGAILHVVGA
jgi:hypothetical protein